MNYMVKVTKWVGYFIALLIVIAATLVSVARLLTPYLNQHKAEFENFASQLLNTPVKINNVRITWDGYSPQLTLSKVIIVDNKTNKPIFEIRQIKINAKIFESIIKRELILSYIKISGMDLTIHSNKSGTYNVLGIGNIAIADNVQGGMHEANEVVAWIFSQPALVLSDIHVTFYTPVGVKKSITLDHLSLTNSKTKHFLSGKGTLNQDIPTQLELAIDWWGENFDLEKMNANLYLYIQGVSLPQWFKQQSWQHIQIKDGLGSAKIWAKWDRNQLQKIQTQLQLYNINLYSVITQKNQIIPRLSGHFGWKREGKNQIFAGNDILMDLPNHLWPTTSFVVTLPLSVFQMPDNSDGAVATPESSVTLQTPSKIGTFGLTQMLPPLSNESIKNQKELFLVNISYVDLADIRGIIQNIGLLPVEFTTILKAFDPNGEVRQFSLNFQKGIPLENNKIAGKFYALSFKPWHSLPGMNGLNGDIVWNGSDGYVNLDNKNLILTYPSGFDSPIIVGGLKGKIQLQKSNNRWMIQSKKIQFTNPVLEGDVNLSINLPKDKSPFVDVTSHFEVKKANHLVRYFPLKLMEGDLSRWMKQAFRSGTFSSGKVLLRGELNEFPFSNQRGIFTVSADVKDMNVGFALGWPTLEKVNGTIQFIGHKMVAEIKSGFMRGLLVKDSRIEIPYIGKQQPQILFLNGIMEGDLAQGKQIIQHSPLKHKLGMSIASMQMTGPMQLKLNVNFPLKFPEQAVLRGDLVLKQATLGVLSSNSKIDNIMGVFKFSEKSIEAPGVTATLWGEPITLDIHTQNNLNGVNVVNVDLQGRLTDSIVHSFVNKTPYENIIKGGTTYQANLQLSMSQSTDPMQLVISSDLKGVALTLPLDLSKKAEEVIPSKAIAYIREDKPLNIKWIYGNKLTAATTIRYSTKDVQLYSAEINIGTQEEAKFQSEPGILITGQFNTLDWNTWKPYFSGSKNVALTPSDKFFNLFRGFNLRAQKIIGFFQPLNDVHLQLSKEKNHYSIKIDSAELVGIVNLPLKWQPLSIQASFERVYLSPFEGQKELLDPTLLPAISFVGHDVRYHDKKIGRVSFNISPIKHGVTIESFQVDSSLFNFSGVGEWVFQNKKPQTHFEGKLIIANVAEFLSTWGSPTVNPEDSSGTMLFDLKWPNAPYSPTLSDITGKVNLSLGAGHIVNLDQATNAKMGFGRILNLLSLDSISRALTLNFSKLTEKGYSFDSVKGDFILKNGNAYTDSVTMEGSIARIEMMGRLGLAAKDYDIDLSVTPFVTGSIPVVAALAVNPIVGIAAWAVEKIAGKAVSSATTHKYKVTGTWEKPVWVEK